MIENEKSKISKIFPIRGIFLMMCLVVCCLFLTGAIKLPEKTIIQTKPNKPNVLEEYVKNNNSNKEELFKIFKKETEEENVENPEEENTKESVETSNENQDNNNSTSNSDNRKTYRISSYVTRNIPMEYNIPYSKIEPLSKEANETYDKEMAEENERYENEEEPKDEYKHIERRNEIVRRYNVKIRKINKMHVSCQAVGYEKYAEPEAQSLIDAGNILRIGNYFAGHNPGVFSYISTLKVGDYVIVDGKKYVCVDQYFPSGKITEREFNYYYGATSGIMIQFCINSEAFISECVPC